MSASLTMSWSSVGFRPVKSMTCEISSSVGNADPMMIRYCARSPQRMGFPECILDAIGRSVGRSEAGCLSLIVAPSLSCRGGVERLGDDGEGFGAAVPKSG